MLRIKIVIFNLKVAHVKSQYFTNKDLIKINPIGDLEMVENIENINPNRNQLMNSQSINDKSLFNINNDKFLNKLTIPKSKRQEGTLKTFTNNSFSNYGKEKNNEIDSESKKNFIKDHLKKVI